MGGRDVVLVLDSSMSQPQFDQAINFANDFVSKFDVSSGDARIGLLTYSSSPRVRFHLNRYWTQNVIAENLKNLVRVPGDTNTALALRTARSSMFTRNNGDRPYANNILILITAKDSINKQLTLNEAERARNDGIHVYTVGLTLPDTEELEGIASPPAIDNSINIGAMSELAEVPGILLYKIQRRE